MRQSVGFPGGVARLAKGTMLGAQLLFIRIFNRLVASAISVKFLFGGVTGKHKPLGCHFTLDDLKLSIS
jgi:hypothetical protein